MQTPREQPGRIEAHTIFQIPIDQRHGRARDLFTIWFGTNIQLLTIVTGGLATTVFKLPFAAALLALILGNLIGGPSVVAPAYYWLVRRDQAERIGVRIAQQRA